MDQALDDIYAGMPCAFAIVSALHFRSRTAQGQVFVRLLGRSRDELAQWQREGVI